MQLPQQVRVQYVPYQRTIVQTQMQQVTQIVPRQQIVYQKQRRLVRRPVQRYVTQYIKIQHKVEYQVEYVTELTNEPVVEYEYVPVQKKIYHYPQDLVGMGPVQGMPPMQESLVRTELLPQQHTEPIRSSLSSSKMVFTDNNKTSKMIIRNHFSEKAIEPLTVGKESKGQIVQRRSAKCQWHFLKSGQGFKIMHAATGLVVDFADYQAGQKVFLGPQSKDRTSQNFQYEGVGGTGAGIFRCQDDHNLCLGMQEDSKGEQARVILNKIMRGRNPSQLWQFSPY